ncbi:MAG: heparinase II/III family protein [Sphingomonadales bacterium]
MGAEPLEEAATPQQRPQPAAAEAVAAPAVAITGQLARARPLGLAGQWLGAPVRWLRRLGYRSLFYSLRLRGSFPLKLLASPDDPWPGDGDRGALYAEGQWAWGGYGIKATTPPFDDSVAPEAYRAWLHSFRWLRDVAAINDNRRAINTAEPAVRAWLADYAAYDAMAWRSDLIGERIIYWTTYAPLILSGHDLVYRSQVLNTLARQARHLARAAHRAGDGLPRLHAIIGLMYSGLLLPGGEDRLARGEALLGETLARLVLADGGFATRNPADTHACLRLLIALRGVYRQRGASVPDWLQPTIDRMVPMLKGLLLTPDLLAAFNGARSGRGRDFALTLDLSECDGGAISNAAHSGYQRLARGNMTVLVDTGPPPAMDLSHKAHAAPLALELAHDGQPVLVNCGGCRDADGLPREMAWMTRATAAHSSLTVNQSNAGHVRADFQIGHGAEHTEWTRREAEAGIWLDASHDGYGRRFGLLHRRRLYLAPDGEELRGEDNLSTLPRSWAGLWRREKPNQFDLRFHLHPDIEATPTRDGHAAILRLPNKQGWMFRVGGPALAIEDSLYLDQNGKPRKNKQLVISGPIDKFPLAVNWSLKATHG